MALFEPDTSSATYQYRKREQDQSKFYYGLAKVGKFLVSSENINLINRKLIILTKELFDVDIVPQRIEDIRTEIIHNYIARKRNLEDETLTRENLRKIIVEFNLMVVRKLASYLGMMFERKKDIEDSWDFQSRQPKVNRAKDGEVIFYEDMMPEVRGKRHLTRLG